MEYQLLKEIVSKILSTNRIEKIIPEVKIKLQEIVNFDDIAIILYKSTEKTFRLFAYDGTLLKSCIEKEGIKDFQLSSNKEKEYINNNLVTTCSSSLKKILQLNVQSLYSYPLIIENELIGKIILFSSNVDNFCEKYTEILKEIAPAFARLVENNKLKIQIKELENNYRRMLDNAKDIIWRINAKWEVIYVNKAFEEQIGYSFAEVKDDRKVLMKLLYKEDRKFLRKSIVKIIKGENIEQNIVYRMYNKNGELLYYSLIYSLYKDEETDLLIFEGISRNITESIRLEEERKNYSEKLKEEVEAKTKEIMENQEIIFRQEKMASLGMLASGIAHEIGNPLSSISSLIQLLKIETENDDLKQKYSLVLTNIQRITLIVKRMKDLARPVHRALTKLNINNLICETLDLIKLSKKAKEIEFILDLDENLNEIYMIYDKIHEVFVNILFNAVDAVMASSNINRKEIKIKSYNDNGCVNIIFENSGDMIASDIQNRIFDPFFTTKGIGEGTGLGLYISKKIIEEHKGSLDIMNNENGRVSFILKFSNNVK